MFLHNAAQLRPVFYLRFKSAKACLAVQLLLFIAKSVTSQSMVQKVKVNNFVSLH